MLKIAVCDDEHISLDKIVDLVQGELRKLKIKYEISTYNSGENLLDASNINSFDVIFLDIELKTTNGINIAKRLRDNGYDKLIVFITSFVDYSIVGYKVNAFRFILKDTLKQELTECIQNIIAKLGLKKVNLNDLEVNIKDIIYLESNKHQVMIHLKNTDVYRVYDTLDNIEKKLNSKNLLRVHQSYLVNILYVENIKCYTLVLSDGNNSIEIPIPKVRYSEIKKKISIKKTLWR